MGEFLKEFFQILWNFIVAILKFSLVCLKIFLFILMIGWAISKWFFPPPDLGSKNS